jgi:hypothetical protein
MLPGVRLASSHYLDDEAAHDAVTRRRSQRWVRDQRRWDGWQLERLRGLIDQGDRSWVVFDRQRGELTQVALGASGTRSSGCSTPGARLVRPTGIGSA